MKAPPPVIDQSYDERPAYRLGASCSNCGWNGEIRRRVGYEPRHFDSCPRCGCKTVRALKNDFRGRDE